MIAQFDLAGRFTEVARLTERLASTGLEPPECGQKAQRFAEAASAIESLASGPPDATGQSLRAFYVPGRIEVLGKHTDYAGGRSIVAAAERGFCLVCSARNDSRVTMLDTAGGESVTFEIDPELQPPLGSWSNYPMTVARRIARNFPQSRRGADMAFASDLPRAAGMSSSSAMMVAVFLALANANQLEQQPPYRENVVCPTDLAGYLGTIENGQTFGSLEGALGVGTFGGSEDHTAILCAEPGRVSQYAYCPVAFERAIAVPEHYTFVVGTSGVVAEKTGEAMAKYNASSRRASVLAQLWRESTGRDDPHLAAIIASSPNAAERMRQIAAEAPSSLPDREALPARLEHFLTENEEILPAAGDALAERDMAAFGRLVDRSQEAAEQDLGNQIPETSYLAHAAREQGAAAASAFGAGFGGSVWALVEVSMVESFLEAWSGAYWARFPQHVARTSFFPTRAGPGAFGLVEAG